MQVPPEPVGLDLHGRGADPALGSPGLKAMARQQPRDLGERAEEGVDSEAVGEVPARPVALVGDPGQVRCPDALRGGDHLEAALREEPARGWSPLAEPPPRGERCDELQILELTQPGLTPSKRTEVEALDLVGGEDLALEEASKQLVVSLVERVHARAKVVSFLSSHDLGTVLPSFGRWSPA
jgi:hypothetical protein